MLVSFLMPVGSASCVFMGRPLMATGGSSGKRALVATRPFAQEGVTQPPRKMLVPLTFALTAGAAGTQRRAFEMTGTDASGCEASTSGRDWSWVPYPEGHRKRRGFIANYLMP